MENLGDEITKVAEAILRDSSIEAALTLRDAMGDEVDLVRTKIRMDAARDILDRVVPKKEAKADSQAPRVIIQLPPKSVKYIEVKDD